jgi:mitochondrial import inner membrane translocase subunit TIM21
LKNSRWYITRSNTSGPLTTRYECRKVFPCSVRPSASYSTQASDQKGKQVSISVLFSDLNSSM